MSRTNLSPGALPVRSQVITRQKDFDSLFDGFTQLQAVSYVASPDLLLDFFENRGFTEIELVVGENLTVTQYREALAQRKVGVAESLVGLIERGQLRILVPKHTIHTKLYILHRSNNYRVITGSPNLTVAARRASHQTNYVWYVDIDADYPWLRSQLKDYEAHRAQCAQFMSDLLELLRMDPSRNRRETIDAWLQGRVIDNSESVSKKLFQDLTTGSLQSLAEGTDSIIRVHLPDNPKVKVQFERFLAPLHAVITEHDVAVDSRTYIRYIYEHYGLPIMEVDVSRRMVRLGIDGTVASRSEPPPSSAEVDASLKHVEDYIDTVDAGHAVNRQFAKTSMFEALLYVLAAPFAHEHMRIRQRSFPLVDVRGPKPLYLFGHSQNGKSTFLRFALRLLTGRHVVPQPSSNFNKSRVISASTAGTVFPRVFDHVDLSRRGDVFELVLKSYWEAWWSQECMTPQLIFPGNAENLKEWAKSRLKRLDFDVQFAPSGAEKAALNRILEADNPLFKWFSFLYLESLAEVQVPVDDELDRARTVMKALYQHAHRPLPPYFPDRPVDQIFNPAQRAWHDLLYGLHKASLQRNASRLLVVFSDDMQYREISSYRSQLPQTVKTALKGKTLVVENPREFNDWLRAGEDPGTNWWRRTFGHLFGG